MTISIIVPAYKEKNNIKILINKINSEIEIKNIIIVDDSPQKEIEHLTTISVRHALPNSPCQSTQNPRDQGIYRSGDWMTHASIEGALRSGRIAAEAVLHDLDADQSSAAP